MASMESRLNYATTRADDLVQKRQGYIRYNKRRTQAIERRKKVDDSCASILISGVSDDEGRKPWHRWSKTVIDTTNIGKECARNVFRWSLKNSHLLFTIDNRAKGATRNLKLRLSARQYKARESIEHTVCVSWRVRAARVLQKVMRKKLEDPYDSSAHRYWQQIAKSDEVPCTCASQHGSVFLP